MVTETAKLISIEVLIIASHIYLISGKRQGHYISEVGQTPEDLEQEVGGRQEQPKYSCISAQPDLRPITPLRIASFPSDQ